MLLSIGSLYSYEPLTDEEILIYWGGLTKEERIQEIRKLDMIEHSDPVIEFSEAVAVVSGKDVIFYHLSPEDGPLPLQINVGGVLKYGVEIEPVTFKGLIPDNSGAIIKTTLISAGVGVVIGFLAHSLLL